MQTQSENTLTKPFVPSFNKTSITSLIEKQRNFFASGKTRDVNFRLGALEKLRKILETHETEISDALKADLGKPLLEAYSAEIAYIKEDLHYVMKRLRKWARPQKVSSPMVSWPARSMILPEPFGNTLIIAPWNYPFQLTVSPLIGAIAAGNTAILKPSELTPKTQELLVRILNQTFAPEHVYCIGGGVEESTALLDERFDFIFFTGSTRVGRIVAEKAAKYLTPVCLELGGKSPCIVDKSMDLKTTTRRIAWGKFMNAGQSCVAPDYVLVHQEIYEKFTKEMLTTITEFFGTDPHASESLGRIVSAGHFDRLQKLIEPSKVIMSSPSVREEKFMAPTVMKDVDWNDRVMEDEIFGPVLPLIPYTDLDDVMKKIQARPKPLALYLFSTDSSIQEKVLSNLSYGGACVNDTMVHLTNPKLPFGGVGESGTGSYHGRQSFDLFSHKKSVMVKPFWGDATMRYAPYTGWKLKLIRFFLGSLVLCSLNNVHSSELPPLTQGFDRPECAYVYGNHLYVSNMSGAGNAKDGVGWIQKFDRKGKLVKDKWVQGLHAPKGLQAFRDTLYTTDIDELVMIDLRDGKMKKVPVPGSKLLNDIVIDAAGNLYISDTFGSKVFRMDGASGEFSEFLTVDAPNGLYLKGDVLYVAGYGKPNKDGTGMEDGPKGSFLAVDLKTKTIKVLAADLGKIDGIELLPDGQLLFTVKGDEVLYWMKDGVITGSLRGASSLAALTDVADIGFDPKTKILYVPNTKTHDVQRILLK